MPIFDQGYQHWSGSLTGHTWRWLAVTRHGIRVGLREGKSGRALRLMLLMAWLPALVLTGLLCLWGLAEQGSELVAILRPLLEFLGSGAKLDPREFRVEVWTLAYSYFLMVELIFSMILVMMVGPDLISQDLRYNALPLYFSRPLRRIDYFCGKLGVIVAFLGMVIIVPSIVAYGLGLLFSLDLSIVRDTFRIVLASVIYGFIIAVSAGLLVLALSSLSRNSRYITLLWLAVWIGSSAVSGILATAEQHQRMQRAWLATPGQPALDQLVEQIRAAKSSWTPLVSYTANLSRIGQEFLGIDAVWERLSQARAPNQRATFLLVNLGPQYPWYWSAGVLLGLMGLSVCILNFRIKSLDRLK